MQRSAQADKRRILWDGAEVAGLVSIGDVNLERTAIEAPEYRIVRQISNGVTKIPAIELVYRLDRDTGTKKFWDDFFANYEMHDAAVIYTDAHGAEYKREMWTKCECIKHMAPAYDAANPTFMKLTVTVLPYDIIDITG